MGALLLVGILSVALLLVLVRAPIQSRPFVPSQDGRWDAALKQSEPLQRCERMGVEEIDGPEELEMDGDGRVYAGTENGTVVRLRPDEHGAHAVEIVATPGGRPNGLTFDPNGRLVVSDGYFVPASVIEPDGSVRRLDAIGGGDTAVGRDGTIYFSAPPEWKRSGNVTLDFLLLLLEARQDGELRAYHPRSGHVTVLTSDLYLPDGVALSANEDFVAVGEFGAYRITRHWLSGPRAGTTDHLIDNLPGSPDGLASDGAGTFYVALPVLRSTILDWLHHHPSLKDQIAKLLWTFAPPISGGAASLVVAVDENGRITRVFSDSGHVAGGPITTAEPRDGNLYLGSLVGQGIARCPVRNEIRAQQH